MNVRSEGAAPMYKILKRRSLKNPRVEAHRPNPPGTILSRYDQAVDSTRTCACTNNDLSPAQAGFTCTKSHESSIDFFAPHALGAEAAPTHTNTRAMSSQWWYSRNQYGRDAIKGMANASPYTQNKSKPAKKFTDKYMI